jgi:MtN3 and saliva related transmembrane protein
MLAGAAPVHDRGARRDGPGRVFRCVVPMSWLLELTGLVAAFLTTVAFLPQVIQTWRSRSTAGLNLPMLVVLASGIALWLCYGLGTGQLPVILANGVTLLLVGVLLALKLRDLQAA